MSRTILAADIGGTSSRFGCFEDDGQQLRLVTTTWLRSQDVLSFAQLLEQLATTDFPLSPSTADVVSIAAAGPVERGVYCSPPYLDWDIDMAAEQPRFNLQRYALINDFVAQAYATKSEVGRSAQVIVEGALDAAGPDGLDGTIGVIGAGTNLGKAMVVQLDNDFLAVPSEGGHAGFAVEQPREYEFYQFAREKLDVDYVTYENIISGGGIRLVHWFLTGEERTPADVTAEFTEGSETLAWAARFYGRACRNFALEVLATGGVFIAGGVAAKVPALVTHQAFGEAFLNSPKHRGLLEKIPVLLFTNEESGLWGAAVRGQQVLRQG